RDVAAAGSRSRAPAQDDLAADARDGPWPSACTGARLVQAWHVPGAVGLVPGDERDCRESTCAVQRGRSGRTVTRAAPASNALPQEGAHACGSSEAAWAAGAAARLAAPGPAGRTGRKAREPDA